MPDHDPRTLHDRQWLHARCMAKLILWCEANGYEVTEGETWRTKQQAAANAASGAGISNSLHMQRLAVDFNLFKGGVLQGADAFKPLADYWLTLDPLCAAGYYFHSVDADHFSVTFQGIM